MHIAFDPLAERGHAREALGDLAGELVVELGQLLLFDLVHRQPIDGVLAGQSWTVKVIGNVYLVLVRLALFGADELRREARQSGKHFIVHAQVGVGLLQQRLAADFRLDIGANDVAVLHRAFDRK